MIETALIFDTNGGTLAWHEPEGRSSGSLPDSRDLWEFMFDHRDILGGVAHTHPWDGPAGPSGTDLSTFRACELGLGKQLLWPVVTFTDVSYQVYNPVTGLYCLAGDLTIEIEGLEELRERSRTALEVSFLTTEIKQAGRDTILLTDTNGLQEMPRWGRYLKVGHDLYRVLRVVPRGAKTAMQVVRVFTGKDQEDFRRNLAEASSPQGSSE